MHYRYWYIKEDCLKTYYPEWIIKNLKNPRNFHNRNIIFLNYIPPPTHFLCVWKEKAVPIRPSCRGGLTLLFLKHNFFHLKLIDKDLHKIVILIPKKSNFFLHHWKLSLHWLLTAKLSSIYLSAVIARGGGGRVRTDFNVSI